MKICIVLLGERDWSSNCRWRDGLLTSEVGGEGLLTVKGDMVYLSLKYIHIYINVQVAYF